MDFLNDFIFNFIGITFIISILFLIYCLFSTGHPVLGVLITTAILSLILAMINIDYVEEFEINEEEEI